MSLKIQFPPFPFPFTFTLLLMTVYCVYYFMCKLSKTDKQKKATGFFQLKKMSILMPFHLHIIFVLKTRTKDKL